MPMSALQLGLIFGPAAPCFSAQLCGGESRLSTSAASRLSCVTEENSARRCATAGLAHMLSSVLGRSGLCRHLQGTAVGGG
eukprot:scaffold2260_cov65-Phaeocystis_antarctica.AAC.1